MAMLVAQSVQKFSSNLASDKPAPGGGAAAALTGSLGAGLYVMVLNIAAKRKIPPSQKREVKKITAICEQERKALLKLVDQDACAYTAWIQAWKARTKLPPKKLQSAQRAALQVPLEICRHTAATLRHESKIRQFAGKMLLSDVAAGSALLAGGFAAATATVAANLEGLGEARQAAQLHQELQQLTKDLSCQLES